MSMFHVLVYVFITASFGIDTYMSLESETDLGRDSNNSGFEAGFQL